MLIISEAYNKMIESYNFEDLPEIKTEIRENCTDRFENHSVNSEYKLKANREGSKSLQLSSNFFGDI